MVLGVGVDMVELGEFTRLCGDLSGLPDVGGAFVRRTFSDAERAQAAARHRPAEYLAGRFAAKEAVFKAVGNLVPGGYDLRMAETLDDEGTGQPKVLAAGRFAEVMARAGVHEVLVSITNEDNYVVAFAVAQD